MLENKVTTTTTIACSDLCTDIVEIKWLTRVFDLLVETELRIYAWVN